MIDRNTVPYGRIAAEGVAIVLSILLAFAIDAAWDNHKDRQQERAILTSLAADFEDTRGLLADGIASHERFRDSAKKLLGILDEDITVTDPETIDGLINDAFVNAKTIEVLNGSLSALFASGNLDLIENEELRSLLAAWPSLVDNATEDERWIVDDVQQRFVPYLNARIPTRNIYRNSSSHRDTMREAIPPRPSTGYEALWTDAEFDNLVSNRLSNEIFALEEISILVREVENIIEQIEIELQRR
jgi:hypothetical protein